MAFGQKKEPKAPTFYLKPSTKVAGGFYGKIGDDQAEIKPLATGGVELSCAGQTYKGKPKTGQYGPFDLFVIDGHFWYGEAKETPYGVKYKLKQGNKAEDSADWLAKQAAKQADAADGGSGPAGLAAPAGSNPGVAIKAGSMSGEGAPVAQTQPRPPKPAGYKRPVQQG